MCLVMPKLLVGVGVEAQTVLSMSKPRLSFSLKKGATANNAPGASTSSASGQAGIPTQVQRAFSEANEPQNPLIPTRAGKAPAPVSKQVRQQQEEAQQLDESAFDYDGVYDQMKQVERDLRQAKKEQDSTRKPKYMNQFFKAAELRERDRMRAESKMIQRERAAEGDAFGDKEAFVTSAYKEQQEEWRRAEEEERVREARERSRSRGVAAFHQKILDEECRHRQATVEALTHRKLDTTSQCSNTTTSEQSVSDRARAEQAQAQGLHVELNDDQQIVDRRDLLKRGLNYVRKRKAPEDAHDNKDDTAIAETSSRSKRSQMMEEELLSRMAGSEDSDDDSCDE